jgi:hypothetical protein
LSTNIVDDILYDYNIDIIIDCCYTFRQGFQVGLTEIHHAITGKRRRM